MVWFQCEDCGDNLKKPKLQRHFSMCSATKLSCIDCGNIFGQDSVQWHNQCMTEAEKYGPKGSSNGTLKKSKETLKQQFDFDINVGLSNYQWICSLCDAKTTSENDFFAHVRGKKHRENAKGLDAKQRKQFEQPAVCMDNSNQLPNFDITVGLSNQYPWFCSLCNIKATSQQSLLSHATGNKHRARVEQFDASQPIKDDINVGLSNHHPWFCSLCNTTATSQQCLLSHANGKKHRENVEWFNANQLQQSGKSTMDNKNTAENACNGDSEQKKVDLHVSSGVGNGYSQADKKRKLETFHETWNGEVVQAEQVEGRGEKESKPKKAKKQDHEKKGKKKQTQPDSDFEYDKEDMKLLLVSYSKEELVNLIYKNVEKGSRLMSAILESADHDISQRKIFVRGFGWKTTHEYLKAAFESYGEIEECSVVMDRDTGRSKGYGFVVFKTRKGAREALKTPDKRMYNRTVVCNLASTKPYGAGNVRDMVEPVKIDLTQMASHSDVALPELELAHRHVLEQRHQQPTMEMLGQNIPFYGHSQPPGFDPMYGPLRSNQMANGLPNYCMFGSSLINQRSMVPSNHVGMAGQYFGDVERTWYQR